MVVTPHRQPHLGVGACRDARDPGWMLAFVSQGDAGYNASSQFRPFDCLIYLISRVVDDMCDGTIDTSLLQHVFDILFQQLRISSLEYSREILAESQRMRVPGPLLSAVKAHRGHKEGMWWGVVKRCLKQK